MKALSELERLFYGGIISRREFIARASALGLTAAFSPLLFPDRVRAAVPKKGGRLRIGVSGCSSSDTLDPAIIDAYLPHIVQHGQLRNCLAEVDHTGNAIPELAESWDASPDAKTWVFKLRKGVEFHSGKTMNADDVIFSFNYHRGENSKSPAKAFLKDVKEIKKDDNNTVVFTLESGNADFPFIVSDYHLQIVPDGTTDFSDGMGTGPYMLVNFNTGVSALTKRNPNYWKEGRAHFDEIESICIQDASARVNALMTGTVDFADRIDLKTADLLAKKPGINVDEVTGAMHFSFPMLTDVPPYDNNDVRLALKYAFDREQMLKIILRGHGSVGNDNPISSVYRYFDPELPQRKYDPEKAKFHLKKSGIDDYTFKLHAPANAVYTGTLEAAVLLKEHAAKAGINVDVVRVPDDGYWKEVWMKKAWSACYWLGKPTEDQVFSLTYAAGGSWNDTHWNHEHFNKLLSEARAELDETKRRQMYAEMQRIVRDEGGQIIHLFQNWVFASKDTLKHGPLAGNMDCDGMKFTERWWFA
jgi:peptide/nickel transport system substrate-binding protein